MVNMKGQINDFECIGDIFYMDDLSRAKK